MMVTVKSAETVASNDDLLMEILCRLPIKSVLYFKSVSKRWLFLITIPHFSLLCKPNIVPPSGLFLQSSSYPVPKYDYLAFDIENPSNSPFRTLPSIRNHFGVKLLQSCNGLLCCCSSQRHSHNNKYYIYNPTTKQSTTLPPVPGSGTSKTGIYCMSLAFDPLRWPHYKVICVRGSELDYNHYQIEIYSSQSGLWKVSGQSFTANDTYFPGGVYWNGGINWTSGSCNSLHFMIDEERLDTMLMPPRPDSWGEVCDPSYFGESNGHLHFIETYGSRTTQLMVIYEMGRDYTGWYVKYQVNLDELGVIFPEIIPSFLYPMSRYAVEILSIVRGEKEEDSFMVLEIPGKALRYNITNKTFKKLYVFTPNESDSVALDANIEHHLRFRGVNSFQYIESLYGV